MALTIACGDCVDKLITADDDVNICQCGFIICSECRTKKILNEGVCKGCSSEWSELPNMSGSIPARLGKLQNLLGQATSYLQFESTPYNVALYLVLYVNRLRTIIDNMSKIATHYGGHDFRATCQNIEYKFDDIYDLWRTKLSDIMNSSKIYLGGVVAGTFDHLHDGHRHLLMRAAAMSRTLHVGVTTQEMVACKLYAEHIEPLERRIEAVRDFLYPIINYFEVTAINDPYDFAATKDDLDVIFVTPETLERAKDLNMIRKKNGLRPLTIEVVKIETVDNVKISSTDIRAQMARIES